MCMAGSITLTGCDDFLTPDNKSAVNDVEYFTTSAGLQALDVYKRQRQHPTGLPEIHILQKSDARQLVPLLFG